MEDEYDYFDEGFEEAEEDMPARVEPLGTFDAKGQPNSHGRHVRVRRMSRRMQQKKPNIQSILITKTNGKQVLIVKAAEEGMPNGRG